MARKKEKQKSHERIKNVDKKRAMREMWIKGINWATEASEKTQRLKQVKRKDGDKVKKERKEKNEYQMK